MSTTAKITNRRISERIDEAPESPASGFDGKPPRTWNSLVHTLMKYKVNPSRDEH